MGLRAKMWLHYLNQESEEKSEKTRQYVQRDLEDQIEEEYTKQGKQYQRTQKQEKMEIRTKDVAKLLKEGYTRYKKDDKGYGSIQEKYELTALEVIELFTTPSLKYMKTILPKPGLQIIDDLHDSDDIAPAPAPSTSASVVCAPYTAHNLEPMSAPGADLMGDVTGVPQLAPAAAVRAVAQEPIAAAMTSSTEVNKDELFN